MHFLIISKTKENLKGNKFALIFTPKNKNTLAVFLNKLEKKDIIINKIVANPIAGTNFKYKFFIEASKKI